MRDAEIKMVKKVWVVWRNSGRTEGRGTNYPYKVCETEATALRLGKWENTMGSDCEVKQALAVHVNGLWLVPGRIEIPTVVDERVQRKIDEQRTLVRKAKEAGFTSEELKSLGVSTRLIESVVKDDPVDVFDIGLRRPPPKFGIFPKRTKTVLAGHSEKPGDGPGCRKTH